MRTTKWTAKPSQNIDAARAMVREGARRFLLPFGIIGKDKTLRESLLSNGLVEPRILVIQDVQLLVSPEYIFGVEPGDIVSLHTLFSAVRGDFFKDVELALKLYTPPLVVVATSVVSEENPIQSVLDMMDKVATGCPRLRRWLEEGSIVMEGCLVDPKSRRTEFISRIPFTHSAEDHNVLSQAVES